MSQQQPFHEASAALRQALRLAAMCRTWRRAAAQAAQSLDLTLHPRHNMPPKHLSPLLAELVAGCQAIRRGDPLLVAPNLLLFLEKARPATLHVLAPSSASAMVGSVPAGCTSLRAMTCISGLVLDVWSPNLERLGLGLRGCVGLGNTSLPSDLRGLQHLAKLELRDCVWLLGEANCFAELAALHELTVHLQSIPLAYSDNESVPLAALAAAAARGVQVTLHICFQWHLQRFSRRTVQDLITSRQRLWSALALCPQLWQLQLDIQYHAGGSMAISPAEQQLLAAIVCRELVLNIAPSEWVSSTAAPLLAAELSYTLDLHVGHSRAVGHAGCSDWSIMFWSVTRLVESLQTLLQAGHLRSGTKRTHIRGCHCTWSALGPVAGRSVWRNSAARCTGRVRLAGT